MMQNNRTMTTVFELSAFPVVEGEEETTDRIYDTKLLSLTRIYVVIVCSVRPIIIIITVKQKTDTQPRKEIFLTRLFRHQFILLSIDAPIIRTR